MAKINGITQKTQNPFVNLYELDRESKNKKKGNRFLFRLSYQNHCNKISQRGKKLF